MGLQVALKSAVIADANRREIILSSKTYTHVSSVCRVAVKNQNKTEKPQTVQNNHWLAAMYGKGSTDKRVGISD